MSTEFNYQIDYGNFAASSPKPRPDPNAPLYASEDGVVASLSNSECIFQISRSGQTHVMTFQVLQALDQTREFRTLDEHIARVMEVVPGLQSQRDGIVRVFEGLIARGLLLSDRDFLAGLSRAPLREPTSLRAVFIRACDRPAQLEKLLASLADYERRFGANRHYVLLDDSRSRDAANRHRDLMREFARSSGCKLTYIGSSERESLIGRLTRAVPAHASVLPHLFGGMRDGNRFGGGGGWNLALLLSAGARFAMFDDDHRLPLRRLENAAAGLDPSPSTPAITQFYRNIDNALGAGEEVDADPFELHLAAVGRPIGTLIASSEYAIDRESLRGLPLSRLGHLDGDAPVLSTHHGSYGSSRTESGAWLYQLPASDRAELVRDRDSYLRNVELGSLWYGYRQARATPTTAFTPFAFDNSVLLPCTNPHGRGEDALFSQLVRLCHPNALALELPVAIGHVQEAQRKRSGRTLSAHTPRFNYFISDFVQRQLSEFYAESAGDRLRLLAAHLRDVGAANERGRLHQLREYLAYSRADLIERLQQQYDGAPEAPVWWQADVRTIIEANGRALIAKAAPRLGDWDEKVDDKACATLLCEEVHRLAEVYEAWPSLWEYAREQDARLLGTI